MIKIFAPLYRLLDVPIVYDLLQRSNPATVGLFKDKLLDNVKVSKAQKILDIGCGTAQFWQYFKEADYYGIDININYVKVAKQSTNGRYAIMNGKMMAYADNYFNSAFCVATFHHMTDEVIVETISETLRVLKPDGALHIVDLILPESFIKSPINSFIFHLDRGRCPRRGSTLNALLV
ncbi:MAG: class I SAM-dependent methyltransferase, partial [Magnetococcales bacterium]|nr:class I SAM-dependent methyltransferase [Magnetococcales bacterium]